jgi:alkanesulfonate monooxygenase SsuD/methylene tetrahydromethanopterin reductase-like flavin-dependent oxidoreductase (luciferase family)
MREPVLLAKQVATLDHISGGRVTLAVAAGGYRDEFESVVPDLADVSRIDLMAEGIESLRVLFERPRSTYEGKYRRFVDVESYPKPVQTPLPVFSGGNGKGALQRANAAKVGCRRRSDPPRSRRDGRRCLPMPARRAATRRPSRSVCNRLCA